MGGRAAIAVRPPDHRADADAVRRSRGRPSVAADQRRSDRTGVLGTLNNSAMGYTPWGTYLACEENFNNYFHVPAGTTLPPSLQRYGVTAPVGPTGTQWFTTDTRFDVSKEPNESNRFGWVVEIDPWNRNSTPVKRTGLGRIKHEGAWVQEARDGRVVVYMGDDQINEYIYRFVSNLPWRDAIRRGVNPLDDGILYVARFDANGTGAWLPLDAGHHAVGRSKRS